jgi:rod shape-determining protein MreC
VAGPRRASRRRYVLLLIVLTAVTLITFDTRSGRKGPLGVLGRGAHTVVSPIEGAVSSVARPIGEWWSGLTDSGHLKSDNRKLRNEIAKLKGEQLDAEQAILDNQRLHQILDLPLLSSVDREVGRIVGRDPGNFDSTLTIDKGTEHGIAVDMPVIAPDGSLVGKVIESWKGGAKIRVLTDPAFAVGVQTPAHPPANATTGIAQGQVASHQLRVDDFDPGAKVLKGDRIVTSPLSTNLFPPDLRVGAVTRVTPEPGGQGMTVQIDPYVDLGALQYVVVLLWVPGQGGVVRSTTTSSSSTSSTTTTSLSPSSVAGG